MTFSSNVIDGLWVNGASPSSDVSAIDVRSGQTGSATFTSNTLQDLLPGQIAFVNASATGFQTTGTGNVGFDPTVAGSTLWMGSSDAGAATRTARCTTPVSLILGDAGAGSGSDGGGVSAESGTGTSGEGGTATSEDGGTGTSTDGGFARPPADASTEPDAAAANASGANGAPGCGCAAAGLASTGAWPGLLALLGSSLGYVGRRRRGRPHMSHVRIGL